MTIGLSSANVMHLDARGWAYIQDLGRDDDSENKLVALARELGDVLATEDGSGPLVVETRSDETAPLWEPFNRPEAIGWHNDFSTWPDRPALTLALVVEQSSDGKRSGDWRVASCHDVVRELRRTQRGLDALKYFSEHDVPFRIAADEPEHLLRVLSMEEGMCRARFYGRALRLGCADSKRDACATQAIDAWEAAADAVCTELPAHQGALLICDNWRAMHDRGSQSVGRRSLLCFVRKVAAALFPTGYSSQSLRAPARSHVLSGGIGRVAAKCRPA